MKRGADGLPPGANAALLPATVDAGPFPGTSRAHPMRDGRLVLVAEDDPISQKLIAVQLGILGVAADVVGDGKLAFRRWQEGDFALLLCDIQMPAMDGHALTAAIRDAEHGDRHLCIIAMSADASQSEADYCRANGMDDYLGKPVPLDQLRTMLERWLPVAPVDAPLPVSTEAPGDPAAVDIAVLVRMIGNDPAVVSDFLRSFQVGAGTIALALESACLQGETDGARAHAHKLMSSARSIGARALGDLCAQLTKAGKAADAPALARLWPLFEKEFEAVNACLDELQA